MSECSTKLSWGLPTHKHTQCVGTQTPTYTFSCTHCPPTLPIFSSSSESLFVIMQMDKASEKLKSSGAVVVEDGRKGRQG